MRTDPSRRSTFECLVLQGIWCLILLGFGVKPRRQAENFCSGALAYCDEHGNQSEGAPAYRREISLMPLP